MTPKIKVLVVDDSAMVRKMICDALSMDPQIQVVGTAPDPYVAREKIMELQPDVLTLDIEMPRMDGLTFLKILQQHRPMPVIIISSVTQAGSKAALDALTYGAMDVLAKPTSAYSIGSLADQLAVRIKAAAGAKLSRRTLIAPVNTDSAPATMTRAAASAIPDSDSGSWHPRQIIALGASTGGVEALTDVLTSLPGNLPGIVITQHIPPYFSKAFADRLAPKCRFDVREAEDGDVVSTGVALIAPGDFHMTLRWVGNSFKVALNQNPPVHHCRPAVDVMFRSISQCAGARVVCGILTGMGTDGALGMKALKSIGARTLAQDQASSVVYGMPRAAFELGVVDHVLPLRKFAEGIVEACHTVSASAGQRETSNV